LRTGVAVGVEVHRFYPHMSIRDRGTEEFAMADINGKILSHFMWKLNQYIKWTCRHFALCCAVKPAGPLLLRLLPTSIDQSIFISTLLPSPWVL
jgi:hypothetical protein